MTTSAEPNTRLTGRWLTVARLAWVIVALAGTGLLVAGLPVFIASSQTICAKPENVCAQLGSLTLEQAQQFAATGWSLQVYGALMVGTITFRAMIFCGVGLLLFIRKSDDWLIMVISMLLVLIGTTLGPTSNAVVAAYPELPILGQLWQSLIAIREICLALFFCLFPNGRFVPRWIVWPAGFWALSLVTLFLPPDSEFMRAFNSAFGFLLGLFLLTNLAAQVYRYVRVSTLVERQQTKWVILGLAVMIGLTISVIIIIQVFNPSRTNTPLYLGTNMVGQLAPLALPISIGLAVLRYRLFDIDLIVRRTLVYGALTGTLGLAYYASVVLLQAVFRALTGQEQNEFVNVVSTLAIAGLFFPLRRRIQDFIDRRFYRQKYDAQKVLADFAATCRDETDLDKLTARLAEVIDDTLQPKQVSVWLKPANDRRRTIANGGRYNPSHD